MGVTSKSMREHGIASATHSDGCYSGEEREHTSTSASDCDSRLSLEDIDLQPASQKFSTRSKPQTRRTETDHQHYERDQFQGASGEVYQRAWYEFDFAILLALISPVGNWLTGGDHVKNVAFVALLAFYLHQVIEVPWKLYQKARRRRRPPYLPPAASEDRHRELAISELRNLELFCLAWTVASPFVGVYILRYATQSIMGLDSISWFSTGLFVMATGVRPWSHLVERLSQRTADLQNFIHYPPSSDPDELRENIASLIKRVDALEVSVSRLRGRIKYKSKDVLNHLDDAVDSVKRSLRQREKRWVAQDQRLRSLETSVTQLSPPTSNTGNSGLMTIPGITVTAAQSVLRLIVPKKTLFNARQSEKERDRDESPRPSRRLSSASTVPAQLEAIVEEGGGKRSPQNKPFYLTIKLLHGVGHLVFMPVRVVLRVFLGRH